MGLFAVLLKWVSYVPTEFRDYHFRRAIGVSPPRATSQIIFDTNDSTGGDCLAPLSLGSEFEDCFRGVADILGRTASFGFGFGLRLLFLFRTRGGDGGGGSGAGSLDGIFPGAGATPWGTFIYFVRVHWSCFLGASGTPFRLCVGHRNVV